MRGGPSLAVLPGMRSLLSLPVLLAACAGSPDPGGDVVGTWNEHGASPAQTFTFTADGRVSLQILGEPDQTGTYATSDGQLTLVDGARHTTKVDYLADDRHLLYALAMPDDDGADAVATWTASAVFDGTQRISTLTLRADHGGRLEGIDGSQRAAFDGTWSQSGDDVTFTFSLGDGSTVRLPFTLYQGYLGNLFDRQ
jgi:hypothetical protein